MHFTCLSSWKNEHKLRVSKWNGGTLLVFCLFCFVLLGSLFFLFFFLIVFFFCLLPFSFCCNYRLLFLLSSDTKKAITPFPPNRKCIIPWLLQGEKINTDRIKKITSQNWRVLTQVCTNSEIAPVSWNVVMYRHQN